MKKSIAVFLIFSLAAGAAFAQKAQWDRKKSQYLIEPGAAIRIGVDDGVWGAAIARLWDTIHPEAQGAVRYVIFGSSGGLDRISELKGEAPDVALLTDGDAARDTGALLPLDPVLARTGETQTPSAFFKKANSGGPSRFIPIAYDGMVFCWNKTMLEAFGFDTVDKNKDGLPEVFDTWEEIFALAGKWREARSEYNRAKVDIVFPICLDDPWSGYSSATAGGWEIFKEGDALKPGFDKPEFRAGLEFIKAAADAMIRVDADGSRARAASCTWRWDEMLDGRSSPFGLIGSWMDVKGAESSGGFDLRFGPMPSWKKVRLTPFTGTKGFAINGSTKFPSAAHELMRLIYTKQGMQAMIDSSSHVPSLTAKSAIKPDYSSDANRPEMSAAFAYGYPEPSMGLSGNPGKKAMDVYYSVGVNRAYRAVWDGAKTPEQAQADLVRLADQWLGDNNK